ncbi:MAG: phage portal protein [Firmicutes bacterium]|nr:phage portal protein [Bacillota bacterium]
MDYKGIGWLKNKLAMKKSRVKLRYDFYEQKHTAVDFGIFTPDKLKDFHIINGWCSKAVDTLADRLSFYKWQEDNFDFEEIFNMNNPDIIYDSAMLSALISACSFIVITPNKDDIIPLLQVIDGSRATGTIDDATEMLREGYAELEVDADGNVTQYAYFTKEQTVYYSVVNERAIETHRITNPAPYPLLVPVIYRPDAKRPFGHSRISRACMSAAAGAMRTIKRSEIAAEYYSFPQKYILGLDPGVVIDKERASASSFLRISANEDGGETRMGQFSAASPQPYYEQLKMMASLFAAETGLTLDDLGFVTSNPQSADAIKASHEALRLTARKAQKTFGRCFLNAGYLAACVRDKYPYKREQIYLTHAAWNPIFEPDASQLGTLGDAVLKINQAQPGYLDEEKIHELLGM